MKTFVSAAILLAASSAYAQDLTIRYDFIKDEFRYFQGKREISHPTVRRNSDIKLEVVNLNPFVFTARCDWKQTIVQENSSSTGMAGMFQGVMLPGSGMGNLLGALNLEANLPGLTRGGSSFHGETQFAKLAFENCQSSYQKLYEVEQVLARIETSANKLKYLRLSPYLPSDTLKAIADKLVTQCVTIGGKPLYGDMNVTTFMDYSAFLVKNIEEQYESLSANADSYLSLYSQYENSHSQFKEKGMDHNIKNMVALAKAMKEKYTSELVVSRMDRLEEQYESIRYTPFSYICNYMATGDHVALTLDIYEIPKSRRSGATQALDNLDSLKKMRTKSINLIVKGDIKVATSVGLGFPSYFNQNKTYSNPDTVIRATDGSNFAPTISTFINFYPYQGKNMHIGGTFGVGVPVQGDNSGNINFFLGLSSVLGANSKVVINGGMALGQLQVLDNGQKTGDKLPLNMVPTTKKVFRPGVFFGVSFALGGSSN